MLLTPREMAIVCETVAGAYKSGVARHLRRDATA